MRIKSIMDTNFQDYKKCSMMISTAFCDWKCCKEVDCDICQNMPLAKEPVLEVNDDTIINRYIHNNLNFSIVFGGLEPIDQFNELIILIHKFRQYTQDEIIIYTGYNEDEITEKIKILQKYPNIIVKFGRFIPNDKKIFDNILGVELASHNQYAKKIS